MTFAICTIAFVLGIVVGAVSNEAAAREEGERRNCSRCLYRLRGAIGTRDRD